MVKTAFLRVALVVGDHGGEYRREDLRWLLEHYFRLADEVDTKQEMHRLFADIENHLRLST